MKLNFKSIKDLSHIWPLLPAAIYLITFFILVLVSLITISFTVSDTFPTISAYKDVFTDSNFKYALINTSLYVVVGTPLELFTGIFLALLIYNAKVGQKFIRALFVVPFAFPGLVIATLLFILFDSQGGFVNHLLQGKYWLFPKVIDHDISWRGSRDMALLISLLGKIWRDTPISMLIILSGLNAIDNELIDAAKTMGAGFRTRFRTIIFPMILPSVTTVVLLRSVEMWKEFIFPYILAGNYPLFGTLIERYYGFGNEPASAAVVALMLVLAIIITLFILTLFLQAIKNKITNYGVQ